MATLPTMNVDHGIRLPRNEFHGYKTRQNKNNFGKRLMQGIALTAESYPIKMSQDDVTIRVKDTKQKRFSRLTAFFVGGYFHFRKFSQKKQWVILQRLHQGS